MNFKSRIAPTPSGFLHLGNIFNFLYTQEQVKNNNGVLLLRIDDLDIQRSKDLYIQDIFDCLNFLDITWQEGPKSLEDFKENWSQKYFFDKCYDLIKSRKDFYSCECSKKDIYKIQSNGKYPGTCRGKNLHFIAYERVIRCPFKDDDFVIWRKENTPSYHLISTYLDQHYHITHVYRGEDLRESTDKQQHLAKNLCLNDFQKINFYHHRLIVDDNGKKLSKSENSLSVKSLIKQGMTKQKIYEEYFNWKQKAF